MFNLHGIFPRNKVTIIILLTSKSNFKPEICVRHSALLHLAWLGTTKISSNIFEICFSFLSCYLTGGIFCFSFFYVNINGTMNLMKAIANEKTYKKYRRHRHYVVHCSHFNTMTRLYGMWLLLGLYCELWHFHFPIWFYFVRWQGMKRKTY